MVGGLANMSTLTVKSLFMPKKVLRGEFGRFLVCKVSILTINTVVGSLYSGLQGLISNYQRTLGVSLAVSSFKILN